MLVSYTFRGKQHAVDLDTSATVKDLKQALKTKNGLAPIRQSLKLVGRANASAEYRLASDGENVSVAYRQFSETFGEDAVLQVKDLGPQFSYKGVFVVEYAGPIVIMAVVASRPAWLFGAEAAGTPLSYSALVAVWLWQAHFIKRELETFFVHKFSRPTMPVFNLFKNSWYYWTFAALVSYPLCSPGYEAPSQTCLAVGAALMIASEIVNFCVHYQLSNMRSTGSTSRNIPTGPLFSLVSCPNYTAEVLSWVGFSVLTGLLMSWVFTAVGLAQMSQWALSKHRAYVKQDPVLRRKAIIPFVL